jgi:VWFA-related protein
MRSVARPIVSLVLAALLPATGLSQAPVGAPPAKKGVVQASTDVTIVEVPVYVAGKDGRPVRGLTKPDFELYDEGKRVDTWDLDTIDLEDFSRQTVTPDVALPPAAQRHFFFLFDLTFAQPINIAKARHAAEGFVQNSMKNGDLGAVGTVDVEKGLKLVLSFTSDRDQLAAALSTLALPSLTSAAADPLYLTVFDPSTSPAITGSLSTQSARQAIGDAEWADLLSTFSKMQERSFDAYEQGRVQAIAKEMAGLARMLNSIHGRKNVIYFSEGFDSKLLSGVTGELSGRTEGDQIIHGESYRVATEDRWGRSDLRMALDEMFQIFKRTDCVIYPLDVSGLAAQAAASVEGGSPADRGASTARLGSRGRGLDTLFTFASETGGRLFKNSNDLSEHLEKLQEETALVYLLTYSPSVLTEAGRYHNLKVKVKASGAQVSFRAGYYEPRPWSRLTLTERRLLAAQQIAYGLPRTDIPARALVAALPNADGSGARVPVIIEIPGDALVKNAVGDKLNLEIYAYATDEKLRTKGFLSKAVGLDMPVVGQRLAASGIKFYGEMFLPPGTFWLKILLRVAETGRSGLLIVPVTVPPKESTQMFAAAPLFHEAPGKWLMIKADPRGTGPAPPYLFVAGADSFIPAAGPVLDPSQNATLSLFVYNAPPGADLELRGEIRGKAGMPVGPAAISRTASTRDANGPLKLLCSFRPDNLTKGDYSLWIGLKDRSSGALGETLGFFEVR